jgi:hypothetical protein
MATKKDACWPGYERVPGKAQGSEGSCRKKAPSKSITSEKSFSAGEPNSSMHGRRTTLVSPRSAPQHLSAPRKAKTKTKATRKI